MPHERGWMPMLPSEFLIPALADPKGRILPFAPDSVNAIVNGFRLTH